MRDPREQVADVNHFDNTVVVKFEDGTITLLDGANVRRETDGKAAAVKAMRFVSGEELKQKELEQEEETERAETT